MSKYLIALVLLSLALSGCSEIPTNREVYGALGAGAGALIDHNDRGRGAAIGGVLGYGLGALQDRQEARRSNYSGYSYQGQYNRGYDYRDREPYYQERYPEYQGQYSRRGEYYEGYERRSYRDY